MAGKRPKHLIVRSEKSSTKRLLGGGKRESGGGERGERSRATEHERESQHIRSGGHE